MSDHMSQPADDDDGWTLGAILLHTPYGAVVLATVASVPAAALTVGVQNWGDLLQRGPWWVLGVVVALLGVMAALLVSVTAEN